MIKLTTSLIIVLISCASSVFVYTQLFTDSLIIPKWLFAMAGILFLGTYISIQRLIGKPIRIDIFALGLGISVICVLQSIYGITQYLGLFTTHSIYNLTGSFDNPAGFAACLCSGLPFLGLLLSKDRSKWAHITGWIMGFITSIAVVLSHSRAGVISIAVIGCICLYRKFFKKRQLKYLLTAIIVLLLVGCYWMKKDSADGRLLIWQCGMSMAKDAPWLGHGIGSFEAYYMDYQADYFRKQEHSRYSMLADNVKQPFNEYLGIFLNFGMVGLLILFVLIGVLFHCYKKCPNVHKEMAIYSLISIGVFSLFSYPFTYPFSWIVAFLSVFVIIGEYIKSFLSIIWIKNVICIFTLVCALVGIYKLTVRIQAEREWCKVSVLPLYKSHEVVLSSYESLEDKFDDNPYFLYNYAAVLQEMKQYDESLQIALKCRLYWADYDLELMIGKNFQQINNFKIAEKYYFNASKMCPSRFTPLYKLFHLYKQIGEKKQAFEVAEMLINKPMKIKSQTILMMKREMKKYVQYPNI